MRKGTKHTEQSRKKISEKISGIKRSDTTRERMAFARTVWWAKEREARKLAREGKIFVLEKIDNEVVTDMADVLTQSLETN